MRGTLVAGWVAVSGTSLHAAASVVTLAAAGAANASAGDLISAGGSVSAAGALIYIVKKMTDGMLVARDPARVEAQVASLAEENARLVEEAHRREERLHQVTAVALAIAKDAPR